MSNVVYASTSATTSILDVSRPATEPEFVAMMRQSGGSVGAIVRRYARLAFGPGRLSFADFVRLRLFDDAFHASADLSAYVGQRRNRDLCVRVNHRHDWLGLLTNKVAALSYLAAYGLPTIPMFAIVAPALSERVPGLLVDRAAIDAFLMREDLYPLFGKPVEGFQSLGSIGLSHCDPATRTLTLSDGRPVALDAFVDEILLHYPAGYLFQPLMAPHADIAALCGRRLATARIVTMASADGPVVFRTAWKIPVGGNVADNFWRRGNLLAAIDAATGTIRRVVTGAGLEGRTVATHPDTGLALPGLRHPQWDAMVALALEGARLMRHVPLVGWDIACTETGPVIVEMNETPDFFLVQFAEGRGALDEAFRDFVAFQTTQAAAHRKANRAAIARM